jgi:hypothetical protein
VCDPAALIAELGRCHYVFSHCFDGYADLFPSGYLAAGHFLLFFRILEEVLRAFFVDGIQKCAAHDQDDHSYHVNLHHNGRYEPRKLGEWVDGEHETGSPQELFIE